MFLVPVAGNPKLLTVLRSDGGNEIEAVTVNGRLKLAGIVGFWTQDERAGNRYVSVRSGGLRFEVKRPLIDVFWGWREAIGVSRLECLKLEG